MKKSLTYLVETFGHHWFLSSLGVIILITAITLILSRKIRERIQDILLEGLIRCVRYCREKVNSIEDAIESISSQSTPTSTATQTTTSNPSQNSGKNSINKLLFLFCSVLTGLGMCILWKLLSKFYTGNHIVLLYGISGLLVVAISTTVSITLYFVLQKQVTALATKKILFTFYPPNGFMKAVTKGGVIEEVLITPADGEVYNKKTERITYRDSSDYPRELAAVQEQTLSFWQQMWKDLANVHFMGFTSSLYSLKKISYVTLFIKKQDKDKEVEFDKNKRFDEDLIPLHFLNATHMTGIETEGGVFTVTYTVLCTYKVTMPMVLYGKLEAGTFLQKVDPLLIEVVSNYSRTRSFEQINKDDKVNPTAPFVAGQLAINNGVKDAQGKEYDKLSSYTGLVLVSTELRDFDSENEEYKKAARQNLLEIENQQAQDTRNATALKLSTNNTLVAEQDAKADKTKKMVDVEVAKEKLTQVTLPLLKEGGAGILENEALPEGITTLVQKGGSAIVNTNNP